MEDHLKGVYIKAASYCAYQERTHDEVRKKLQTLYVEDDDCEYIISQLIADNYLNEQRYAETFAGGKFRIKKWGKRKILFELKKKNLSDYTLKTAFKDIRDSDYKSALKKLAKTKLENLSRSETNKLLAKKKLVTYLIQKGYEQELVWQTVNELFA